MKEYRTEVIPDDKFKGLYTIRPFVEDGDEGLGEMLDEQINDLLGNKERIVFKKREIA